MIHHVWLCDLCLIVFVCMYFCQNGIAPLKVPDESLCPLTHRKQTYDQKAHRFHLAVASLRCFDVRKNTPDKKPHFDFQDPDDEFISKIGRAPLFGPMFWPIFVKILRELHLLGKKVLGAATEQDVQQLMEEQITV